MVKKLRLKAICRVLFRSNKDPESMARGLGIGLFVAFLPSIGFQTILALFLASALGANRMIAAVATLVTNPLTTIPVSAFSIWLGNLILPGDKLSGFSYKDLNPEFLLNSSGPLLLAFITGCLALSIVTGSMGYLFLSAYFKYKRGRQNIFMFFL